MRNACRVLLCPLLLASVACAGGGHDEIESCEQLAALGEEESLETARFIGSWMNGSVAQTEEGFRFYDVLDPEFWLHTSDGSFDLAATQSFFFDEMYGSNPDLTEVRDENFRVVACEVPVLVLEFEERYLQDETVLNGLKITSVFRAEPSAPKGVVWLQVHETALPTAE